MIRLKNIMNFERACKEIGIDEDELITRIEYGALIPLLKINTIHDEQGEVEYICINFFGHKGGKYPQRQYFRRDFYDYKEIFFDCRDIQYYIEHNDDPVETGACVPIDEDYIPIWACSTVNGSTIKYNNKHEAHIKIMDFDDNDPEESVLKMKIDGVDDVEIAKLLRAKGYTLEQIGRLVKGGTKELDPDSYKKRGVRLLKAAKE